MNTKRLSLMLAAVAATAFFTNCSNSAGIAEGKAIVNDSTEGAVALQEEIPEVAITELVDTAAYNQKIMELANGDTTGKWPVKNQPYPLPGAILPFKRVIAYYGNLYSKRMGALGEYAPKEMLSMLDEEVDRWEKADPATPVQPALHYIAVVAAG